MHFTCILILHSGGRGLTITTHMMMFHTEAMRDVTADLQSAVWVLHRSLIIIILIIIIIIIIIKIINFVL